MPVGLIMHKIGYFLALVAGLVFGSFSMTIHAPLRALLEQAGLPTLAATASRSDKPANEPHGAHEGPEGMITMTTDQVKASQIAVMPAAAGRLIQQISAPATVMSDPDKVVRVAAKVTGTVTELRKRLGDPVKNGEIVAIIESREIAEAKSEYLAAQTNFELQEKLFRREQILFEKQIAPEQRYLKASATLVEARLKMQLARQKLAALDLSEAEVSNLRKSPLDALRLKEIRSPGAGIVTQRFVSVGTPVGGEGQPKELYVISDMSTVWLDLAVPSSELRHIKTGQVVAAKQDQRNMTGRIAFISPELDKETRSARVIASFANADLSLRSGEFLTAQIELSAKMVDVVIPVGALQTVGKEKVVFVRTESGFEKREVVLGESDGLNVHVVFGLEPGEEIATSNTFVLKAELGKSEAEHSH